jgi:leucyl/phenylalanyl-tRNA--protein transferase
MPVYRLPDELVFPPPEFAEKDGLLAVGGDLSEHRIVKAYSMGIFPWYTEGSPILWWSPDPRLVLFPSELKVSRSLRQIIKKNIFEITMDTTFESVIKGCARVKRHGQDGTWITDEMLEAYMKLHDRGYAHSVESRLEGKLVGGLYGVSLGGVFFGESMFATIKDASKVAFVKFVRKLMEWEYTLIDCQVKTSHLIRFGAREIPRSEFLKCLRIAHEKPMRKGNWSRFSI